MSSKMNQLAKDLRTALTETDNKKPAPYDTQAEVVRVDGETAWVHIPGGVEETPVRRTINAKEGDNVQVRVSGGRAWITGNVTNPPTDDTRANTAYILAQTADENAEAARNAADKAEADAERAHIAADSAERDAEAAHTAADEAMGSAIAANIASNSALTQLSVVEDVASVLTWISEHGTYKLTDDTAVVSGKLYFSRSGDDYSLITAPTGNPHTNGYYEIDTLGDEAVSNYISSHLSLTNAGLWVVKDNSGYKILLANDGMRVYDNLGNLVVTYGTSIEFANNREFHIGNQNAYIIFNPSNNGSITIGGSNIILGTDKTLSEVLADINNTFIFDVTYTVSGTDPNRIAHFEAHLYQGGEDIKTQYDPEQFTWYLKTEDGEDPIIPTGSVDNTGYTIDVNLSDCGYGAEVIAHFTTNEDSPLLTGDDDNLTDVDNTPLTGRTPSGDSVRVRDLTVSTTLYSSDKLLIVGSEDEHLATISTIADVIWEKYGITIEDEPLLQGNNVYENLGLGRITNSEIEALQL